MFYLSRISVRGFKSMGNLLKIDFDPDFNVITGSHGSGKSNLCELLYFVSCIMKKKLQTYCRDYDISELFYYDTEEMLIEVTITDKLDSTAYSYKLCVVKNGDKLGITKENVRDADNKNNIINEYDNGVTDEINLLEPDTDPKYIDKFEYKHRFNVFFGNVSIVDVSLFRDEFVSEWLFSCYQDTHYIDQIECHIHDIFPAFDQFIFSENKNSPVVRWKSFTADDVTFSMSSFPKNLIKILSLMLYLYTAEKDRASLHIFINMSCPDYNCTGIFLNRIFRFLYNNKDDNHSCHTGHQLVIDCNDASFVNCCDGKEIIQAEMKITPDNIYSVYKRISE